ncbi:hypothetical protein E2C01_052237 [Portunus trituberculatus]|uniref:Uncharacterized protein n=1 Tax=Portunus trituberculatus TaxID=210409 RepID=A0A5B7GDW7_PORTR|nr:hypothetical protein [Portunus trituberculatus]
MTDKKRNGNWSPFRKSNIRMNTKKIKKIKISSCPKGLQRAEGRRETLEEVAGGGTGRVDCEVVRKIGFLYRFVDLTSSIPCFNIDFSYYLVILYNFRYLCGD